ncbi:MAG: hypothetical protein Q9195_007380 [Heterodermia aff. obscurata]
MPTETSHDALVVGTGFAGLYALHLLKQLGLSVHAIDYASDVGGTWHWNRYPGARSDVESYVYRYSWDREHLQTSPWPNNYLTQPEIQAYFQDVSRRHDLYRHIQFRTDLREARWDAERGLWVVRVREDGKGEEEVFAVRYLVTAIGLLYKPNVPDLPGLESFQGQAIHSSKWTPEIEYKGKDIAVIGSGASGVQLVSSLAAHAKSLTNFIRHAQYVLPAALRSVDAAERRAINERYDEIWREVFTSAFGFGFHEPARPVFSVSAQDREAIFQSLWDQGSGFRFLFGGFSDIAVDEAANREAIKFIHGKIREIVKDRQKAAVLTSSDWFARRPLTDDSYYQRFNQENVFAVDLKKSPITAVTATGIETADGKSHPADLIVFATGFDAVDGSYSRVKIRGRGDKLLSEQWAEGPKTHTGASTSNFPNLLFINGPGAPFANNPPATEEGARFAADLVAHAEAIRKAGTGTGVIESTPESEDQWQQQIETIAAATLFSKTGSWFFGENVPGKKVAPRLYFGGLSRYRAALASIREEGYRGFSFGEF